MANTGPVGGCSTGHPSRLSAVSVPSIAVCRPVVWRFTFPPGQGDRALYGLRFSRLEFTSGGQPGGPAIVARHGTSLLAVIPPDSPWLAIAHEIGRASCRERV